MLSIKDLTTLAINVAKADSSAPSAYSFNGQNFSYEEMNDTLRNELNELAGTYALYRENKNNIFSLMENTIEEVLPKRVLEEYGQFAEIKTFAQGDKPVFTQKITNASRRRAKQFIGKVGLAGLYETFRLDGRTYEVDMNAIGGAAQIGFEEFLDKRVDFADVLDIVLEGLDACIYVEIEKQLVGAINNLQPANKSSQGGFDEKEMDRLISICDSYGNGTTIYCTFEFAATILPATGWISDEMRNTRWNNGYLGNYKGHKVVVLPQSYEDETNMVKVINPQFAYIIPTGAAKPVKIAIEGGSIVDEYTNYDRSREIQIYKKIGVRAIFTPDICVYQNTSLDVVAYTPEEDEDEGNG